MSENLFDLAEGPWIAALKAAGAWKMMKIGVQFWGLPGQSRCVTEEEALAWLKSRPPPGPPGPPGPPEALRTDKTESE